MSGIFSNRTASLFNSQRDVAQCFTFPSLEERYSQSDATLAFHEHWESLRPDAATEIGFAESSYVFIASLLRPVSDDEGYVTDIPSALEILRSAYRSCPEWRETLTRMGQWLHTVEEFCW